MCVYMWKFNTIPEGMIVERFIDDQVSLFARYSKALTGADGEPVVDLMKVEHNCGAVNLEFQLNGVDGQSGDLFCFPGYYPGDMDDDGIPLFNICDTHGYFYAQIVATVLERAQKVFDIEITSSIHEQRQFHPAW